MLSWCEISLHFMRDLLKKRPLPIMNNHGNTAPCLIVTLSYIAKSEELCCMEYKCSLCPLFGVFSVHVFFCDTGLYFLILHILTICTMLYSKE